MSAEVNEVLQLLSRISLSDSPKKLLTDLKITITSLQLERISKNVSEHSKDFNILFDYLNSSDIEQVELCVDILRKLLPLIDARIVIEQFSDHIFRSFVHPTEAVRCLALNQVKSCAEAEGGISVLLDRKALILGCVKCVGDEALGVVKLSTLTLITICSISAGVAAVFSNEAVSALERVMTKSDSCRFNVYDIVIKVGLLHDEALAIVSNSGLLDRLISEVTGGDILIQLNALEMLTPLAVSPSGLALLQNAGVVSKFQYLLSLAESDPLTAMLLPGLLKFFGNVGHVQAMFLAENFSSVYLSIFKLSSGGMECVDPVLEMVALETLTHIAVKPEGKYALMKFRGEMEKSLEYFGSKTHTWPTNQKIRVYEAVIPLFTLQVHEHNEELLAATQEWWTYFVGMSSIESLVGVIKQPFPDLHEQVLSLLKSLVSLPWGQRYVVAEPGFVEYLLDRSTESIKQGKELKWEIMKDILQSPYSSAIFDSDSLDKMKKHYGQGPFYVEADPQLAFEGDGDT